MPEYKKIITQEEVKSGILRWTPNEDSDLRKVFPQTLVFDLLWDGKRYDHLTVEWEKHELFIGEPLMRSQAGAELLLINPEKYGSVLEAQILGPAESIIVRKRLSLNEFKHRYLKWFAREDEIYRRLLPSKGPFAVEIDGKVTPSRHADFEKRTLIVGEALRKFSPGDTLIIHLASQSPTPTLAISKEEAPANRTTDPATTLRAIVTRLISRPLSEFNEGEVKGLITLLDENKSLWERLMTMKEENEKLKEQVATLETVFDQFSRNSFFTCKRDLEDWVVSHITTFEKGIRILHRDYSVTWEDGQKSRVDLLCQDRKGVLVAVEIVFNPVIEDLESSLKLMSWLKQNIESLGKELTDGKLKANSIRGMIIANREKPDLIEICLQSNIKLCVVNSGFIIDVIE